MKVGESKKAFVVQAVGTLAAGTLLAAATHQLAMVRLASAAAFGGGGLMTELVTLIRASSIRRREAREAIGAEDDDDGPDLFIGEHVRTSNEVIVWEGDLTDSDNLVQHVAVIDIPVAAKEKVIRTTGAEVYSADGGRVTLTLPWAEYQRQQKAFQTTKPQ
jgi:hypothetical protein